MFLEIKNKRGVIFNKDDKGILRALIFHAMFFFFFLYLMEKLFELRLIFALGMVSDMV